MTLAEASPAFTVSVLIVGVAALLVLASATRVPTSIMLFTGGSATGILLGSPKAVVDPHLLIGIVLPPLLYASTVTTSVDLVRRVALPGLAVGAGLTIAIFLAVASLCLALMPDLGWSGAAMFAIIAAASSTELVSDLGLSNRVPRRAAETIKGRGLVAPLLMLPAFQLLTAQLGAPPPSLEMVASAFAKDWVAGGVLGLILGDGISRLRGAIKSEQTEIAVSLGTPFLISVVAELASIVVVVPLIAAALIISIRAIDRKGRSVSSPKARILGRNFWREALVLLTGAQFLLSGLALPGVFSSLGEVSLGSAFGLAAAILAIVSAVELAGGMVAVAAMRSSHVSPARWSEGLWIGLLPGRSSLALLLVLVIPGTLPDGSTFLPRDLILVTTVVLVVGSALLQWAILPLALRRFGAAASAAHERDIMLADGAIATVDGSDADAVAAARIRLLTLRRRGDIGDETALEANDRLDGAVGVRAVLKPSARG